MRLLTFLVGVMVGAYSAWAITLAWVRRGTGGEEGPGLWKAQGPPPPSDLTFTWDPRGDGTMSNPFIFLVGGRIAHMKVP